MPTVFRWHFSFFFGLVKFPFLFFRFLSTRDIEKRIWISFFVFAALWKGNLNFGFRIPFFRLTFKSGFDFRFLFFVFSSLWKTDLNFGFRFCIACYWKTDWGFVCHFCMNLKSGLIHQSFETPPPPPPPQGDDRIMRGLSLHNHFIFIPR